MHLELRIRNEAWSNVVDVLSIKSLLVKVTVGTDVSNRNLW